MQANKGKHVFGLDILRCLAISLVVFSSLFFLVPNSQGVFTQLFSISGILGVEIFFVLSGFLLGNRLYYLYTETNFTFRLITNYFIKRSLRVLPLYYCVLILNIGLSIYISEQLPYHIWHYVVFIQNFDSGSISSFFYESWSMSVGVFATIIGFLMLYLKGFIKFGKNRPQKFLMIVTLIIISIIVAKVCYAVNDDTKTMINWSKNLKTVVIYRIDAVFYGVLAAFISIKYTYLWKKLKLGMLILSLILLLFLYVLVPMMNWFIETSSLFWNVFYLPLNSIAIILLLPILSQWKAHRGPLLKPITDLSSISYAIYIVHYSLVIRGLNYLFPMKDLPLFDTVVCLMVYLSMLLLIAVILNKLVEKPMIKLHRRFS